MLRANDNWERLVGAVLKRQQIWELCHAHSRSPSLLSEASSSDLSSSNTARQIDTLSAYGQREDDASEGSGNRVRQQQSQKAKPAVQFLLENLRQLLTYRWSLITGARNEVQQLQNDLRLFNQFLRDERRREDNLGELVRQIRDVAYEAEDAVDFCVSQAAETKSKNYFTKFSKDPSNLRDIVVQAARARSQIEKIYGGRSRLEDAIDGDNVR